MYFVRTITFLISLVLCSCTNFEALRRQKFEPDYATKIPTIFLPSKTVNGKFVRIPLKEGYPLMLLKRGFGYSVVQLYGGKIGEVSTEAVRPKEVGEKFEEFYVSHNPMPLRSGEEMLEENLKPRGVKSKALTPDSPLVPVEVFPVLNNSLESVEPELPEI